MTVVVVHQEGRPQFVRTIGIGGSEITAGIAAALDLPQADAEAIKLRLGDGSAQSQAAEFAVQSSIQALVGEISSPSSSTSHRCRVVLPSSVVLVTGGGSLLRGFIPQLQAQVRIPVQAVSPLARLNVSALDLQPEQAAAIHPVLAAPIGLALPEANAAVRNFNLFFSKSPNACFSVGFSATRSSAPPPSEFFSSCSVRSTSFGSTMPRVASMSSPPTWPS